MIEVQEDDTPADVRIPGQVARGSVWSISGKVAVLLASLIGMPFTLRLLDPAEFGVWTLMSTIMTYLVIVDFGMATASTKFAGAAFQKGDPESEARAVWTALGIASVVGTMSALLLALLAPIITELLSVPHDLRRPAVLALRLVSVTLILRTLTSVVSTPSLVRFRWKGVTFATAGPAVALALMAPICLVLSHRGVVTIAVAAMAAGLIALLSNALIAIRLQPKLLSTGMDLGLVGGLSRYGATLTAAALVLLPLATADRFLLAHYWSPAVVAPYAVAITFAGALSVIPVAAAAPLLPAFVRIIEMKDWPGLGRLYRQTGQALFLILVPAAMFLAFLSAPLLKLYAGADYGRQSVGPFLILLAGVVVNAMAYVPYNFLLASGRVRSILFVHLLQTVPYVVVAAWLTSRHQAGGAAAAWTLRVVLDSALFYVIVGRDHRLTQRIRDLIDARSALLLGGLGVALTGLSELEPGPAGRIAWVCLLGSVYLATAFRAVLSPQQRQAVAAQVRRRMPGTRGEPVVTGAEV
jgi:O-antigen/teichoic acid export membrane protein